MPVKTEVVNIAVTLIVATGASLGWRWEQGREDREAAVIAAERLVRVEVTTEHNKEELGRLRKSFDDLDTYLRNKYE